MLCGIMITQSMTRGPSFTEAEECSGARVEGATRVCVSRLVATGCVTAGPRPSAFVTASVDHHPFWSPPMRSD